MIKSFRCKETYKIFEGYYSKKFPPNIQNVARRKLMMIHAATLLSDLKVPPGNCLEQLKGDKKNICSIRINIQWRICFSWDNDFATEVEIIDYH